MKTGKQIPQVIDYTIDNLGIIITGKTAEV
jgi:hypothetical protein